MLIKTGFSKLKLAKPGSSGVQQIRIQSASAKPITMSSNTLGAQVLQQQPKNITLNKGYDRIFEQCLIVFLYSVKYFLC